IILSLPYNEFSLGVMIRLTIICQPNQYVYKRDHSHLFLEFFLYYRFYFLKINIIIFLLNTSQNKTSFLSFTILTIFIVYHIKTRFSSYSLLFLYSFINIFYYF